MKFSLLLGSSPLWTYLHENTDAYIWSFSINWNTNCSAFNMQTSKLAFGGRVALEHMFLGLLR
jgi:hypothetical protein